MVATAAPGFVVLPMEHRGGKTGGRVQEKKKKEREKENNKEGGLESKGKGGNVRQVRRRKGNL